MTILYYVHDPMCSWCWGFRPVWEEILAQLPADIEVKYLLGGLAPDSDEPMPQSMQEDIAGYWQKVQRHIPHTEFNFDFWDQCEPRRSTYPACRAVIAARKQQPTQEREMIKLIQTAYYLKAKNPSDDETLIALAVDLGLDKSQFTQDLNSPETQQQLQKEIQFSRTIGAQGFPSLIIESLVPKTISKNQDEKKEHYQPVPLNYNDAKPTLAFIKDALA